MRGSLKGSVEQGHGQTTAASESSGAYLGEHQALKTFLIIVFIILPACGIFHLLRMYSFARGAVRADATVIGHEETTQEVQIRRGGLSRSRLFRYPKVRFSSADGQTHTVTLRDERPRADRGDPKKLTILYPKARPERARIAHWRARYALAIFWFLPAVAVVLALLGFTIQYYAVKFSGP